MIVAISDVPEHEGWLIQQTQPVIVVAPPESDPSQTQKNNVDVLVDDLDTARRLTERIEQMPVPALVLVQVLRATAGMPVNQALLVESLAYSSLQAGGDYQAWLAARPAPPRAVCGLEGDPIVLQRIGNVVRATLNRSESHNSLTVEMRDALLEALLLLEADPSIERFELSAAGKCFSVGGELREFGLSRDPAKAHGIRCKTNPAYLFARHSHRLHCHLHGACIGAGIELPAFAAHVTADPKTFFQLPELDFGLIPGAGGCISIARRMGRHRAAFLVLSGKRINAKKALEWGLIDSIVGLEAR